MVHDCGGTWEVAIDNPSPPYRIDCEMMGRDFLGTLSNLHYFVRLLADVTERPESDFLVEQHVTQYEGVQEPTEAEWNVAVERFIEDMPELFKS